MSFNEFESIRRFYEGANIFITGASGFIGEVLVEKLLRSCPRIGAIYILMRPKKNLTMTERIQEMTSKMVNKILERLSWFLYWNFFVINSCSTN